VGRPPPLLPLLWKRRTRTAGGSSVPAVRRTRVTGPSGVRVSVDDASEDDTPGYRDDLPQHLPQAPVLVLVGRSADRSWLHPPEARRGSGQLSPLLVPRTCLEQGATTSHRALHRDPRNSHLAGQIAVTLGQRNPRGQLPKLKPVAPQFAPSASASNAATALGGHLPGTIWWG
jgi:hypothetical protein